MTITKNLMRLFIASFITATITTLQLHAMEMEFIDPAAMKTEFQTYKLLSMIDNPDYYLLPELVQIIATNVSKLIDKYCYAEYEAYLTKHGCIHIYDPINDPKTLLDFIKVKVDNKINHIFIANTVKRCLRYSGKSLGEIKYHDNSTIFHDIMTFFPKETDDDRLQFIKTLLLVAEKEAWNIICTKNNGDYDAILQTIPLKDHLLLNELLSVAPSHQEAWRVISTPNKGGITVIDRARNYVAPQTINLLESYRPKGQ
jgi:hypothetical protein